MPIRPGPSGSTFSGRIATVLLLLGIWPGACLADPVRAEDHRSFWLWAGVKPQAALHGADELYLLAGEVRGDRSPHIVHQRSATPRLKGPKVWIVYRAQTLNWDEAVYSNILAHADAWRAAGNDVMGLQIDFDAGTRHLERYAAFLSEVRTRLPARYRLGVTGLLDWSANGDPRGLDAVAGIVDEIVLQIYQGRRVIPGYQSYLKKLGSTRFPFRIGLLQGGDWKPPPGLAENPLFRGYVVFLVNEPG